ncbi:MAG: carbohydrate kinase family protein [Candidatus Hydrothermarchaeales archaeon]
MDEAIDVIGVGALNVDRLYLVDKIAHAEEEVAIKSMIEAPGGSSANTIVGLSRLGIKTGFIGKVGNDTEGEYILNDFRKENVDASGIQRAEVMTGVIIGFVDEKGERALYANPGANDHLDMDETAIEYAKKAKFLHFASFVGERSYGAQLKLMETLSDVKISFSPGMLYAKKGLKELDLIIENTSILFLNKDEAELLTGWDYKRGAEQLLEIGAEVVVVTLGEKGCFITTSDDHHLVKGYKIKPTDTTGAGDAFAAGFLYGILMEEELKICGQLGNWVATHCIKNVGARDGLPYKIDLKKF